MIDSARFQKLTVIANMGGGGIASNDGRIYLDSILESVAARWSGKTFAPGDPPATFEIPLARVGSGKFWVWECSESYADWQAADIGHKVSSFATDRGELLDPKQRKVNISGGEYKSYRLPLPIWLARSISWRCVGDAEMVSKMLDDVEWIGREHNRGKGRVNSWSVVIEPKNDRHPIWRNDGHPSRPLPIALLEELGISPDLNWLTVPSVGFRPPYWHAERRAQCVMAPAPRISNGR